MSLSDADVNLLDQWWRFSNYLSVAQIYLLANPLLREPLKREHIKSRLLGHFGTSSGLTFMYVHLNRIIKQRDVNMIYIIGPGHGGPALVAAAYMEGSYSETYTSITQDERGLARLFKQFSFPGGIPSHVAAETPGSIHEGGELGYALSHAFGAAFDNPDLVVACVVGDGEAETGPLATAWQSNKFLNPVRDGAVLPILHLNGYKIAGPTVLARIPHDELAKFFQGMGWEPLFVEGGDDVPAMHRAMAAAMDRAFDAIAAIQRDARAHGFRRRPTWPMIILRSPKGWTGPKVVDGKKSEGTFRSHQVPMSDMNAEHIAQLSEWLKSYRIEELLTPDCRLKPEIAALAPTGERRMSANPHANGGVLLRKLKLPDFRQYAVPVTADKRGVIEAEATRVQGKLIRDVVKENPTTFRVFSPDETSSNRWNDVFSVTDRCWCAEIVPGDESLSPNGRVMEILSEHNCEGWLEGYLLTGRHGFFSTYEAFVHVVDSMVNQHAKWLKSCEEIDWRRPVASLNILLTSHVWQQQHNGASHQDPGFVDLVCNKKASIVRAYFPPDANCLLSVTDHVLKSTNKINVVVAGKAPTVQWLTIDEAIAHCTAGVSIWPWASNDVGTEPDVVLAACGDVATIEILACAKLLREMFPDLRVRVVNVVDLMVLQPKEEHPHGLSNKDFDAIFTKDRPIIMAFHGYPWLIHRLTYRRTNHKSLHVRGFKEMGTTTTSYDMCVLNDTDRWHLAQDVIDRVDKLQVRAAYAKQDLRDKLFAHRAYVNEYGVDMPEVLNWRWNNDVAGATQRTHDTQADNK
jgi:xylulose-5-phosphate/fructose-6-phosphate phosphoketolase